MRKFLLFSFTLAYSAVAFCQEQYSVSTEVEKRKILLEEFTGVNCGWCPEGHKVAKQLVAGMAGEAFAVNVHAGYYSEPGAGQPDFRTSEGTALSNFFATSNAGYPCGTVNRYCYNGSDYLSSRNLWLSLAERLNADDAIVNLDLSSTYDGTTGKLSVTVEGYYTGDVPADSTQRLNVLWTQDEIYAYQNGGDAGDEYEHNHMLRGYISPMWGDAIDGAAKGQYFRKTYELALPEKVGDAEVKPEDINVIAFVCEGRTNVENVAGGKPHYENYGLTEAAELRSPDFGIGTRYGFNFFEAKIKNRSAKQISSATFDVTIDGQTEERTIDCNIGQFAVEAVTIPVDMHYASKGKTKYTIEIKKLNGVDIEASQLSGGFQKPIETGESVEIKLVTDEMASQNTFTLRDQDGQTIREFGPYDDGPSHEVTELVSGLEDGKTYCFEVYDSYGDGLLEGTKGSLIIHSGTGKLIDQFYTISGYGVRSFFTVDKALGIRSISTDDDASEAIYSIDGRRVGSASQKGIYIVKSRNGNKKIVGTATSSSLW